MVLRSSTNFFVRGVNYHYSITLLLWRLRRMKSNPPPPPTSEEGLGTSRDDRNLEESHNEETDAFDDVIDDDDLSVLTLEADASLFTGKPKEAPELIYIKPDGCHALMKLTGNSDKGISHCCSAPLYCWQYLLQPPRASSGSRGRMHWGVGLLRIERKNEGWND